MLKRVEIEQLTGINRNAVEGVAQTAPRELRGFDMNKAGGYYAAFAQSGTPATSGVSASVASHDNYGVVLLDDESLIFDDVVYDFSASPAAGKRVYLVPRVGAVSHARTTAEDTYEIGAFVEDVNNNFGAQFDQGSAAWSVSNTSGNLVAGSYKAMALWLKPTAQGLVVYDTSHYSFSASGNEVVTITSDGFIPAGYGVKTYLAKEDDSRFSQYFPSFESAGTVLNQPTVFSDGDGALEATIGTFASGSLSVEVTNNAIINFCSKLACVEPHNQRIWSRAAATPFVGPFIEGYSPLARFEVDYTISSGSSISEEFFDASASTAIAVTSTSDPQFNLFTRFDDGIRFEDSIILPSSIFDFVGVTGSASHVLDVIRENNASGVNLAFGVNATTTLDFDGYSSSLAFTSSFVPSNPLNTEQSNYPGVWPGDARFSKSLDVATSNPTARTVDYISSINTTFYATGEMFVNPKLTGNNWGSPQRLTPPSDEKEQAVDEGNNSPTFYIQTVVPDEFGASFDFDNETLVVGAPEWGIHIRVTSAVTSPTNDDYAPGRVYVYEKFGSSWSLQQEVRHPLYDVQFGDKSVNNDGLPADTFLEFGKLIGVDKFGSGSANEFWTVGKLVNGTWQLYRYVFSGGSWSLNATKNLPGEPFSLKVSDGVVVVTIVGSSNGFLYEAPTSGTISGPTTITNNFSTHDIYGNFLVVRNPSSGVTEVRKKTTGINDFTSVDHSIAGLDGSYLVTEDYLIADDGAELYVFDGNQFVYSKDLSQTVTTTNGAQNGILADRQGNYVLKYYGDGIFGGTSNSDHVFVYEIDEATVNVTRKYDWRAVFDNVSYSVNYQTLSTSHVFTDGGTNTIDLTNEILVNKYLDFTQSGSTITVNILNDDGVTIESSASISGVSGSYASGTSIEGFSYEAASYSVPITTDVFAEFYETILANDAGTQVRLDADDYAGGASFTDASTSTVWTLDRDGVSKGRIDLLDLAAANISRLDTPSTIVYSDIGYVNFASSIDQFLQLELNASDEITALVSTPAGLLVFANNETFLVRGDPSNLQSFAAQRFSATIGCDDGVRPARLGGNVFTIWKGRLYSMLLGMGDVDFGSNFADIGAPVYNPEDPFVQVVGEPRTRQIVVRTEAGRILRYSSDVGQWFNDVFDNAGVEFLLPNADDRGSRFLLETDLRTVQNKGDSPYVQWENVDLGNKGLRKQWRRIYAYFGDDYGGAPTLEYDIGSNSGTITGSEEGTGWFTFTLPNGLVNEKAARLRITMAGAAFGDEFEPPVIVEFVDRYSRR